MNPKQRFVRADSLLRLWLALKNEEGVTLPKYDRFRALYLQAFTEAETEWNTDAGAKDDEVRDDRPT